MDLKSLKNNVNILKEEFVESSSEKDSMSSVMCTQQNKIVELKEKLKSAKTENVPQKKVLQAVMNVQRIAARGCLGKLSLMASQCL